MSSPGGSFVIGLASLLVPIHLLAAVQPPPESSSQSAGGVGDAPDALVGGALGPEPDTWPVPATDTGADSVGVVVAPSTDSLEATQGSATAAESAATGGKPAPPSLSEAFQKARRAGFSWDLQVEMGGPVWANTWGDLFEPWIKDLWEVIKFDKPDFTAFARVRVGFLLLEEPWYFSAGLTAGYGGVGGAAVGLQADLTNIWGGLWIQSGAEWNEDHGLVVSAGGGYQVIGGEWRVYDGGRDIALLAKVRLPLGLVAFVKGVYDRRR